MINVQHNSAAATFVVAVTADLAGVSVALENFETKLAIFARVSKPSVASTPIAVIWSNWEWLGVIILRLSSIPRDLALLGLQPSGSGVRVICQLFIDVGPIAKGFMAFAKTHPIE